MGEFVKADKTTSNRFRMKLFNTLSALAVVKAQVPDFSDLNALFASLTNDLADVRNEDPIVPVQDNAAGARYLVATTTVTPPPNTTTPPPPTPALGGTGCWKCDAMSFTACATGGYFQTCSPDQTNGDNGVCFLELRETNQFLTQLCTGCKDRNSCYNLRRQNFVGSATGSSGAAQMTSASQNGCFSVTTAVTETNNPLAVPASKCATIQALILLMATTVLVVLKSTRQLQRPSSNTRV